MPAAADPCALGAMELGRLYRARRLSPVEVVTATLHRIARLNPALNAYISTCGDAAMAAARVAEAQFAAGIDLGPLQGVPVSVKDIMRVRGTVTTAASALLRDAEADSEDAEAIRRLRAAGAVVVGKTNLHEFAFGAPDAESAFGVVQNPRRAGRQAGGSSSGSGAAVAAGLGVVSLGTDTGGSVRYPASLCGVAGLKPTHGRVSLGGVIPVSVRFDQVGPLARSVADLAACLTAIAGYDPDDPTSSPAPVEDYVAALARDPGGLRLGTPSNACFALGTPASLAARDAARDHLRAAGMTASPVHLPRAEEVREHWETVARVDLWDWHAPYLARQSPYGRHFRDRARLGAETSAVAFARALSAIADIRRRWLALFDTVDVLVLPGNLVGAPAHGAETVEIEGASYPVPFAGSPFNRLASVTGFPALTVPVGEDADGLPIAVQLVGPPFSEGRLLAVGHVLERAVDATRRWGIEPRTA